MQHEDPVQLEYVDALGRPHHPSPRAVKKIRAAIKGGSPGRGGPDAPLVVPHGDRREVGTGEITLEDGARVAVDGALPAHLPIGYHTLQRRGARGPVRLIIAPRTCYLPDHYKVWGWAIQLYAARSRRSWGIGDLSDLRTLGKWSAKAGASIALVNPLAAATPVLPQQASPYFPTSRRFRNPLYLRVEEMDGARGIKGLDALAKKAHALNGERLIDRDRIYRLKMQAFEKIWRGVRGRRDPKFDRYVDEVGRGLIEYATFCALAEKFGSGWHAWPEAYRNPRGPKVLAALDDRALGDRVAFHAWLQYQVDLQLARASAATPVMQDLPIGFDADGADAWAYQHVLAHGVSVGAPPDEFNTRGQNWGLPPFVPQGLRAAGYQPFIDTIRACLRHAGGLRIDHVMGLFRLFWIPLGMEPKDGAYVHNPAEDLLSIVALESQRAKAVIVGEDLGTVDEGFRKLLMAHCSLSYRLVWFEPDPPKTFPQQALAALTTHDLPTAAGMWTGADLETQKRLKLSPNEEGTREIHKRLEALAHATKRTPTAKVIANLYRALAAAPSRIVTATLDDAMAVEERPNMPATSHEWPNWSIALPKPIETLPRSPLATSIARTLGRGRKRRKSD